VPEFEAPQRTLPAGPAGSFFGRPIEEGAPGQDGAGLHPNRVRDPTRVNVGLASLAPQSVDRHVTMTAATARPAAGPMHRAGRG